MCPTASVAFWNKTDTLFNTPLVGPRGTYVKNAWACGMFKSDPVGGSAALNCAGMTVSGQGTRRRLRQWPWYLGNRYHLGSISLLGHSARLWESDRIVNPFCGVWSLGRTRARDGWIFRHRLPPFLESNSRFASTSNGSLPASSLEGIPTPSQASSAAAQSCNRDSHKSRCFPTSIIGVSRRAEIRFHHLWTACGDRWPSTTAFLQAPPTCFMCSPH